MKTKDITKTNWLNNIYIAMYWVIGFFILMLSLLYKKFTEMVIEYVPANVADVGIIWGAGLLFAFGAFVLFESFELAYNHLKRRREEK